MALVVVEFIMTFIDLIKFGPVIIVGVMVAMVVIAAMVMGQAVSTAFEPSNLKFRCSLLGNTQYQSSVVGQ